MVEIRNAGGRADTGGADLAAADGAHTLAKRVRGIIDDRLDILVLNGRAIRSLLKQYVRCGIWTGLRSQSDQGVRRPCKYFNYRCRRKQDRAEDRDC